MAARFFDTSAFAKRYRPEAGTGQIDSFLNEAGSLHYISILGVVELHSVLARLVREGQITADVFHLTRKRLLADIASGLWTVLPLTASHFYHAQLLLMRHGLARRLRTLDAIQLAASLLNTPAPLNAFVCADRDLARVAVAEGLNVVNPEFP